MRADEAKMLLQSLGLSSEKKDEKRKNRTKTELLLINMIKLDHFGIVVFGFWSEMFRSAPCN